MFRRLLICSCAFVALVVSSIQPLVSRSSHSGQAIAAPGESSHAKKRAARKRAARKRAARKRAARKRAARKRAAKRRAAKRRAAKKRARKRARGKRKRRSNMPKGWTWPPSTAMQAQGKSCLARLDELGVVWKKGADTRKVANPVVVPDLVFGAISLAPTFRKGPFVMDCFLALALAVHSQAMYDAGVRVLRFSSIHQYRKAKSHGKRKRALSRHALGLAVDVYEITMDDGTTLIVENDYAPADSRLRAVEDAVNATGGFRTLLSPKNDPKSHNDHFHFAAGMRLQ